MTAQMQVRGGAMLLWRLGPLEYGEQSRWSRAPASRGMWAFPWPFFDEWFAFHQYEYKLPRRLRTEDGWPVDPAWYRDRDGNTPAQVPLDAEGHIERGFEVAEGFYDARNAWIRTVGRTVVPRRKFWYSGEVFTHLRPGGEVGSSGLMGTEVEWHRMDVTTFAAAARSCGTNKVMDRYEGRVSRMKSSLDHLEVFLPAGAGRIHGRTHDRDGARTV